MPDRFEHFDRADWAALRDSTPLSLDEKDIDELRGINEYLDIDEVEQIYLPLSRLINLHVIASRSMSGVAHTFLRTTPARICLLYTSPSPRDRG